MARRALLLVAFAASAAPALAQHAASKSHADIFFGAPPNQAFTPDAVFPKRPLPTPPPAPPDTFVGPPAPPGPDGGLLPPLPKLPPPWSGSADLGLNGVTGNSEVFNLRVGSQVRRKTDRNVFVSDLLYQFTKEDGATTTHQALWNARDEVLFPGSPWSPFGSVNLEYDQLREFDFRVGVYTGVGYTVVDDATAILKFRAGAGAVRELVTRGGFPAPTDPTAPPPADRWVPEFLFGYDFRYAVNDRGAVLSVLDYYPRVDDFSQFRVRVRGAYEYVLDPATGTVLRLGVQDRYDSKPGTARRNDLTYFATLGIKF